MSEADLAALAAAHPAEAILRYVDGGLLPLWAKQGWDSAGAGGFHERLGPDGVPLAIPFRRVMVSGRQLYVFSRAYARFGRPDYAELAHRTYAYLTQRFWDERHGGWYFSVDPSGAPLSRYKDLYGQAFALFGLAHYHAVFGVADALDFALRTDEALLTRLLLPSGWFASTADENWTVTATDLNQNPHMHLLEAYIALFQARGNALFRDRASELVELFFGRLFDRQRGVLVEFFDGNGRPHPERGHQLEPGHHFEWHWLLNEFADTVADRPECRAAADRLFSWATLHGVDAERGGVFDQVAPDGRVLAETKRIWPQTERIKAEAVRLRHGGENRAALLRQVEFLFRRYLLPNGGWFEALDADLQPINREQPASTCYHLMMAFEEVLRSA